MGRGAPCSCGEPCAGELGPTTSMASLRERFEHRWCARHMSAYVDGDLSGEQRRRLERHANLCPECDPMRRTLMRLTLELRHLRADPWESVAPRVIERWIESDRERASSGGGDHGGP
jgi:anti-sigma factor RsiW